MDVSIRCLSNQPVPPEDFVRFNVSISESPPAGYRLCYATIKTVLPGFFADTGISAASFPRGSGITSMNSSAHFFTGPGTYDVWAELYIYDAQYQRTVLESEHITVTIG
jgi:hypothetical protein